MKKKRYLLMLECELHQWAKDFGDQHERSISYIVNRALRNAKDAAEKKIEPAKPKKQPAKTTRFEAPSIEDVQAYCNERGNSVDAQEFVSHYEASGWMRGKTKIKDWKACVRTWEKNNNAKGNFGQNEKPRKQSAAERQQARINARYGHTGGGLGMAEGYGDLRGAMGEGERGRAITHVEPSLEQAEPIDCEEWNKTDY